MDNNGSCINGLGKSNLIFCCKGSWENYFRSVGWQNNSNNNNNNPKSLGLYN